MAAQTPSTQRQRIGVLLCADPTDPKSHVQFLDTAAVDLFSFMDPEFLVACGVPESAAAQGHTYEFLYIAEKEHGPTVNLSGGMKCVVTVSLNLFFLIRSWRITNKRKNEFILTNLIHLLFGFP